MRLTSLMGFLADDLAVDLGTANTLVYVRGHGIVLNEPSIVAMKDGTVLAAGHEAKAMLGRAPGSISVVRPLRHGVIADFDSTEKMLHYFIAKTRQRKTLAHPRVVVTVPSGHVPEFEALMAESAIPWRWIGTTGGDRLVIRGGGEVYVDLDCARLEHAWRTGFERHLA